MSDDEEKFKKDYNLLKAGSTGALMVIDEVLNNFKDIDKAKIETLKLIIHNKVEEFYNIDSKQKEVKYYQYSSEILKLYNRKTRNRNNY